jgi:small subunit ribosomal protein S21e
VLERVSDDVWIKDRLITSKDHASVQIVIADVDANGRALSTSTSFALSGQVRAQGEGDDSVNRLATKAGCKRELLPSTVTNGLTTLCSLVLRNVWSYSK